MLLARNLLMYALCSMFNLHIYLPGHRFSLQFFDCIELPLQAEPPADGEGLVHVLLLVCVPLPQVLVHLVQSPYWDQAPFTVKLFKKYAHVLE